MNLIAELQYFPSLIFYKYSYQYTDIVFEQYENYQKMSFRNRCIIGGANGPITLSIPLEDGRNQRSIMKDVRISNAQNWQIQHLRSIESVYNKSPWFEFYKEELRRLYLKPVHFLTEWNLLCFEWTISKLGSNVSFSMSGSFRKEYVEIETFDFRNKLLPKNYTQYDPIKYRQVFEERTGFLPNLSILDLLFCEGKNSQELIKEQSRRNNN
jgi:hypothetical protein